MRLSSVRAFKQEAEAIASAFRVEALLGAAPEPVPVALGIAAGTGPDDYRVAVRVPPGSEAAAEEIRQRASGEADVRIIAVSTRPPVDPQAGTPDWANGKRRPLEPGLAISPAGSGWVGTLFGFGRRANGSIVFLSNSHVLGAVDRVPRGTPVLQPLGGEPIGVTAEDAPMTARGNIADLQVGDLRRVDILPSHNLAVGPVRSALPIHPSDLGREATKFGRTTGVRVGTCTAVEIDDLPVNYGAAGVKRFDDAVEFSGHPADFSAGGDSGSMILWRDTGDVPAILFAGGVDSSGSDRTYGCPAARSLALLGITLL